MSSIDNGKKERRKKNLPSFFLLTKIYHISLFQNRHLIYQMHLPKTPTATGQPTILKKGIIELISTKVRTSTNQCPKGLKNCCSTKIHKILRLISIHNNCVLI